MAEKSSKKKSKFGAGKIAAISIIIGVVLVVAILVVIFGILDTVVQFVVNLFVNIGNGIYDWWQSLWGNVTFHGGTRIYFIEEEHIDSIKSQLEAKGIDTDTSGLTSLMLKKMVLADAVTSSTQDTLCIVPVTEEEILEGIDDIDERREDLTEAYGPREDESDIAIYLASLETLSAYATPGLEELENYYLLTDSYWYIDDKDGFFDDILKKDDTLVDEDDDSEYYLAILGKTEIVAEDGQALSYITLDEFNENMKEYSDAGNKDEYLKYYSVDENGNIIVYKLTEVNKNYKYCLTNTSVNESGQEITYIIPDIYNKWYTQTSYECGSEILQIENNVDSTQYVISIELLLNMLNLTGSPQYIDEFVDYAMEHTKVKVTAYSIEYEEDNYSKTTYDIGDPIYESYNMSSDEAWEQYGELICNRIYKGNRFYGSVVDLEDEEDTEETPITDYLKHNYTTESNNLGVVINKTIKSTTTHYCFLISSMETWYGNITYGDIEKKTYYYTNSLEDSSTNENEDMDDILDNLTLYTEGTNISIEEKIGKGYESIYTSYGIAGYYTDNLWNYFYESTTNVADSGIDGNINVLLDWAFLGYMAGDNSDSSDVNYIYISYDRNNIKNYNTIKTREEILEQSKDLPTYDTSNAYEFLGLWKNETGEIDGGEFVSNGKVVRYKDIYHGTTEVGNMFESAPELFFALLEESDNTKNLVDIFKYIMYLYTGIDYGITSDIGMSSIFSTHINARN